MAVGRVIILMPVMIALYLLLGYDTFTGMVHARFVFRVLYREINPFFVGVAFELFGIPVMSGV